MVYLFLVSNRKIVLVFSFFAVFSFLIFFLKKEGMWVRMPAIIGYIIFCTILFGVINLTSSKLIYEVKNSVILHPAKAVSKAGSTILIVFAILFSMLFYFNFPLLDRDGNIQIKEDLIKNAGDNFESFAVKFFPLPIYDMEMSVDEFIIICSITGIPFIKSEEDEQEVKPLINLDKSSEAIKNYIRDRGMFSLEGINIMEYMREDGFRGLFVDEVKRLTPTANIYLLTRYRKNLSKNWGIELEGEETMGTVYTRFLNAKINEIPENIKNLILIIPAFILFGVLEIAFLILNMIFSIFALVLFVILYKTKFYRYRKVQVEKEEIEL
jgi:hypothetical protein